MIYESAEVRLAQILITLTKKFGDTIPLTRQELAELAGTTHETTIRTLSRLGKQVVGAGVAAAAALLSEGRPHDARGLVDDDASDDADLVRALCDCRQGRLGDARVSLEALRARAPSSWVAAWMMAEIVARTGRATEARALLTTTLALLNGTGAPAGELVALLPELHPQHVMRSGRAALEGHRGLWHRP
jgi:hypothetical protein